MRAQDIVDGLSDEIMADASELYSDDGTILPVKDWPMIWRTGLVAGIETVQSQDKEGKPTSQVNKLRLSDRVKRVELPGKHHKLFSEQVGSVKLMCH